MKMNAEFSECGLFRYLLTRQWDDSLPILATQMLNPSDANHEKNDPTVSTLIRFCKVWGFGGVSITNTYALISSSPKVLPAAADPFGPCNDHWLLESLQGAGAALVAWGNYPIPKEIVAKSILRIQKSALTPMCMGTTKSGAPKHPLARGRHRIPATQQLIEWRP